MTAGQELGQAFSHREYVFHKQFWKIFGGAFHIYDSNNNLVFYSKQKAFKLKEDFRVYGDEGQTHELLDIKTPKVLDISATYYVFDPARNEQVGALKRKGLKSIVRDEWVILGKDGKEIGKMVETNMVMAILSRLIKFVPQGYSITTVDNREVATIKQHFNPIILKYTLSINEPSPSIDPRLLISAGILLCAIEGRQEQV